MISKNIKDLYKEDLQDMKTYWQRGLKVTDDNGKRISKRRLKKEMGDDFWHSVHRALYHMTTSRELNGINYNFRNTIFFK